MHDYTLGTVIFVTIGLIKHYGIISGINELGEILVISNSKARRCVTEEPLGEFSLGRQTIVDGYPSNCDPRDVVARARSQLGIKYDLFSDNCEHFVRWAHRLKPESPQLQLFSVLAGAFVLSYLVARA